MGIWTDRFRLIRRLFDTPYCERVSNALWKGRMAWVQEQAACVPAGSKVLDVGAGPCPYRENFAHCQYIAHDFAQTPGVPYGTIDVISDICSIPLPDGSFDVVLCTEVLEHVPEPVQALHEMHRLLKTGGMLILTAPLGSGQHQKPYHFYGGFTRFWYEHFLPRAGFQIESLEPCGGLYGHLVEMTWRTRSMLHGAGRYTLMGRVREFLWQLLLYNLPAVVFERWERANLVEDFSVGFLCVAVKRDAPAR